MARVTRAHGPSDPDAVVLGAGHNGLVAANMLADQGWSVVVCEATAHVGGAVRSEPGVTAGFTSDVFSAFYPLAAASHPIRALHLEDDGLRWTHAPTVLAHIFPDDRSVTLSRDASATAASVEAFADGDGQRWLDLVEQWQRIEDPMLDALLRPFPPMRAGVSLARRLGTADSVRLVRQALLPARRFTEERFAGEGAALLLAGNALHADIGVDAAGSGLYGWLLTMLGQTHGFPVPVGGAGQLTRAMADRLSRSGGVVRTLAPVSSVEVAGGEATGVRLESGEVIRARRAVLADVAAPLLYGHLVDSHHLPDRLLADLAVFQWDTPTLKINWELSGRVPWTAPQAADAGTLHLGVDLNGLSRYAADLACDELPRDPFVLVGQMTTADASRSPVGTESLWAYTHLPQSRRSSWADIDTQVTRVEDMLNRHAPGLSDLVRSRTVQPPLGLHTENPNLVHGAINGGTAQIHQQLVFRPVPGLAGAATPVDRLYLAGSSAHPGGGVHGAAGANAATAALARAGWQGGVRRAVTSAMFRRVY